MSDHQKKHHLQVIDIKEQKLIFLCLSNRYKLNFLRFYKANGELHQGPYTDHRLEPEWLPYLAEMRVDTPKCAAQSPQFWERLLRDIRRHEVVPIVGKDLLEIEVNSRSITLERFLAEKLAESCSKSLGDNQPRSAPLTGHEKVLHGYC